MRSERGSLTIYTLSLPGNIHWNEGYKFTRGEGGKKRFWGQDRGERRQTMSRWNEGERGGEEEENVPCTVYISSLRSCRNFAKLDRRKRSLIIPPWGNVYFLQQH